MSPFIITYPPILSDQGKWASALPEPMRQWLIDERAQAGDALIIRVVDATDARYEARLERKRERKADTVIHRNREIAEAAYQILRRRSSSEVFVWDLATALIARGLYHAPVPPGSLETILAADPRFVDAGWQSVVLAEDVTPELEALIRRRKEPLSDFLQPAPEKMISRVDATSLRRSSEKALVDIGRAMAPGLRGTVHQPDHISTSVTAMPPSRRPAASPALPG